MKIKSNWTAKCFLFLILIFVAYNALPYKCPPNSSYLIEVMVKNKCHKEIHVAVHYRDSDSDWVTTPWIKLDAFSIGKDTAIACRTNCREIYVYAKSADGKMKWVGKGTDYFSVSGSLDKYFFNKVLIPKTKYLSRPKGDDEKNHGYFFVDNSWYRAYSYNYSFLTEDSEKIKDW